MEEKLKPCPFCGSKAEFSVGKTGDGKDWHYIECDDCGAVGPRVNYADHNIQVKEANAEAWNGRSKDALLSAAEAFITEAESMGWGKTSETWLPPSFDNLKAAVKDVQG